MGEGNKAWRCDWELLKQNEGSKFRVPPDESLKGSVIQVVKEAHQIFVKPLKLRRYSGGTGPCASLTSLDVVCTRRLAGKEESTWPRTNFTYLPTTPRQDLFKVWTSLTKQASLRTTSGSSQVTSRILSVTLKHSDLFRFMGLDCIYIYIDTVF